MSRPFWRLAVASEFSAAHALRNYQGKCEHIHGHNFTVEVVIEGDRLTQDTEFLMDFSHIKKMLKETLATLDHKDLNTTAPFDRINPSSENMACHIFRQLKAPVATFGVRVYSVTVGEKPGQCATYYEG
ncbi:6-carboxytetrahydropterin synthase QueD [Desulfovibrio cuneatus]|uniref:6-carboxytetrahydropterin synthase QueD n=1 Tax=Desulfovibrio cuneatus TaxID=159728 RepID=UPI0003F59B65|nr:6-carboxytetrahydropterin synthase QueD [Desulfovibrio cuneatus]